ncbi:MAG: NUDIX domain-containing protein [Candidatus Thorarchaeota archaeon]
MFKYKVITMKAARRFPKHPIPSVAAVVVSSKGILLKKRSKPPFEGLWNIISGVIEVGETQEEALMREVKEEAGINCRVVRWVDTYDLILTDQDDRVEYHYLVNVYLLEVLIGESKVIETENVRWFHPSSLPVDEMPVSVAERLEALSPRLLERM